MTNWRTNLGGAFGALGTALIGVGTLSQLTQLSPNTNVLSTNQLQFMWWVAFSGFVMSALGKFFTALFAADAKTVSELSKTVSVHDDALRTGDTSIITRSPDTKQ